MINRLYKVWENDFKRFISSDTGVELYTIEEVARKQLTNPQLNYTLVESTNFYDKNQQLIFAGDVIEYDIEWYKQNQQQELINYPYEIIIPNRDKTNYVLKNLIQYKNEKVQDYKTKHEYITEIKQEDLEYANILGNIYEDEKYFNN